MEVGRVCWGFGEGVGCVGGVAGGGRGGMQPGPRGQRPLPNIVMCVINSVLVFYRSIAFCRYFNVLS